MTQESPNINIYIDRSLCGLESLASNYIFLLGYFFVIHCVSTYVYVTYMYIFSTYMWRICIFYCHSLCMELERRQPQLHMCGLDSVFVKHILLHISGSWLIGVRLVHSWAGAVLIQFEFRSIGPNNLHIRHKYITYTYVDVFWRICSGMRCGLDSVWISFHWPKQPSAISSHYIYVRRRLHTYMWRICDVYVGHFWRICTCFLTYMCDPAPSHAITCASSEIYIRICDVYVTSMWRICDVYVTYMWRICDVYMTYMWRICDVYVTSMWRICDVYVTSMWRICDVYVTYMWRICDVYMTSMWRLCDVFVTYLWRICDVYVGLFWRTRGCILIYIYYPASSHASYCFGCQNSTFKDGPRDVIAKKNESFALTLQHAAICCKTMQHTATHCNTQLLCCQNIVLQHASARTATHCNMQ